MFFKFKETSVCNNHSSPVFKFLQSIGFCCDDTAQKQSSVVSVIELYDVSIKAS